MKKRDFNREWTVKKVSTSMVGDLFGGSETPADIQVTLPHDAMIYERRNAKSPAGGACGFYQGGDYEYTKQFYVEKSDCDQTFLLEFEGIYNRGYVYVNGALAGSVHYGYTGTVLDITQYLHFGEQNMVLVKAINSDVPNSRWYTGSGIYRPVYLYQGGNVRIGVGGVRISTPEISDNLAMVKTEISIDYDEKVQRTVLVKSEVTDCTGQIVAGEDTVTTLFAKDVTKVKQRICVQNPQLWSVEQPTLYKMKVSVWDGEKLLDEEESLFGIRKLELNPLEGLKVNGEKVLLRGACIHHDNGPVGAATFARAEERRVEILKEAGFNSVRIAHNSSSKAMLDACDRLGMLVMEESYDMWTYGKSQYDYALDFADHWEEDLEDIVKKDFNHPSVFMYCIGNEISDLGTPEGAKWSRKLADKFRQLDATRYVSNAVNGLTTILGDLPTVMADLKMLPKEPAQTMESEADIQEAGAGDINDIMTAMLGRMNELSTHPFVEERLKEAYGTLDLIGLNYMRGVYEEMEKAPNRIFYGSETLPPDIDLNWKKVKELNSCIGDYTWTGWDYIGEAGVGIVAYNDKLIFTKPYPAYLAYCGDIDITGFRRPFSYYREVVFGLRKTPYIAVQLPEHYGEKAMCTPWSTPEAVSSWTWNGYEGKGCKVEVYSDAPEVEVFINGNSIGRLPAGEENRYRAIFDTVYQPGEIKAISHYADGTIAEDVLKTADNKVALCLDADRNEIGKDDLSYVAIELKDAAGILHTSTDRNVKVTVEGAGCLQGLGSADPYSEENFFDEERKTFYGRAVAVVRAGAKNSTMKVCVEADGVKPAFVEIEVK